MKTITLFVFLCFFLMETTAFQWNDSLAHVLYPTQECLQNPPVNVFYYTFLFTVDSPLKDFCQMNVSGCSGLCKNTLLVNSKSTPNLDFLAGLINNCLYCNSSESMQFRRNLSEGKCEGFRIGDYGVNIGPKLFDIMEYHCGDSNFPVVDLSFVNTDYFRKHIYTSSNTTIELKQIISFFFSYYTNNYQNKAPPLNIPVNCWCNYETSQSPTFSFQCHDVNTNFLMYSYRISPLIFTIVFFLIFILHFIFLIIPKFTERIIKLNKALSFEWNLKPSSSKVKYTILHFFHISVHPPVLFSLTLLLAFVENLVRVLSNYAFFYEYYLRYFVGIFRGLGGICGLCGYSSLVIMWSHTMDLASTKKEAPLFLSKFNMIVLGLVYLGVLLTLIVLFALFIEIDENSAYIVLSVSTLVYTLSFVLGFLIYGFKMMHKLRTSNIWEYRFTKFIVFLLLVSTPVWILCTLVFITFSVGFDVFGSSFGNSRNIILDLCIIAMTVLSSYITINEEGFKKLYGERLFNILTCSFSFNNNSKPASKTTISNSTTTNTLTSQELQEPNEI